eukprot:8755178-Lingulodinium_polyedra.AAC.1
MSLNGHAALLQWLPGGSYDGGVLPTPERARALGDFGVQRLHCCGGLAPGVNCAVAVLAFACVWARNRW